MEHSVTISSYHPEDEYQVLEDDEDNQNNEADAHQQRQEPWSMKEFLLDETNIDNLAESIMPELAQPESSDPYALHLPEEQK